MAISLDNDQTTTGTPVVTVTDEARGIVTDAMAQEANPEGLALWIEVRAVQAGAFVYDLYFQAVSDAQEVDAVATVNGLTTVVPERSVDRLRGATLEWSTEGSGGLVLINPNKPATPDLSAGIPGEILSQGLDGPLGRRITALLEAEVNPSIAGHGGRCDLVAIDETTGDAYVKLSGGCQGCAMSRATLSDGIETMLRSELPNLGQVIDVTDHATGENPYY